MIGFSSDFANGNEFRVSITTVTYTANATVTFTNNESLTMTINNGLTLDKGKPN